MLLVRPPHAHRRASSARLMRLLLALLPALLCANGAAAATYAVGTGTGCTHSSLQAALNAAASNASGLHLIKLPTGTYFVPNGVSLINPQANINLVGGYASCTATTPTAGARSVIDASGGNEGTAFDIRYEVAGEVRRIRLQRIDITGGSGETGIFANPEGGGLELRGNLYIELDQGTRVLNNRSRRGGGVFLRGGPHTVVLDVRGGSEIRNNVADIDGGGIYCQRDAYVYIHNSRVNFNEAGRDGGGLWLGDACGTIVSTGSSTTVEFNGNRAGTVFTAAGEGRGGAIFYRSGVSVQSPDNLAIGSLNSPNAGPILFVGNSAGGLTSFGNAGSGGGAIYLEGTASERHRVAIQDAVFANNSTASQGGSAISVFRGIQLLVEGTPRRCEGAFGFGLCSAFSGHEKSVIRLDGAFAGSTLPEPRVTVRRTRFTGNLGGLGVFDDAAGRVGQRMRVEHSVFDNNGNTSLSHFEGTDFSLLYSTVIGNSFSSAVLRSLAAAVNLHSIDMTGSILWQPGIQVYLNYRSSGGGDTLIHRGCLLAHSTQGLPLPSLIQTAAPQLAADWTPNINSPALDVCDNAVGTASVDAYGQARPVDQPWLDNVLGAFDLGAVERPLTNVTTAIFANGFE